MNRREILSSLTGLAAAIGAKGEPTLFEPDPRPLLLVLRLKGPVEPEVKAHINATWGERFGKYNLPPLVILDGGATLEAILDPRAKQ